MFRFAKPCPRFVRHETYRNAGHKAVLGNEPKSDARVLPQWGPIEVTDSGDMRIKVSRCSNPIDSVPVAGTGQRRSAQLEQRMTRALKAPFIPRISTSRRIGPYVRDGYPRGNDAIQQKRSKDRSPRR